MKIKQIASSRFTTVVAAAAVVGLLGAGGAVAAGQIDSSGIKDNSVRSSDIKDGTIQKQDLTADNFSKFTKTSTVVQASTAASTVPAYAGAKVVDVPAGNATNDSRTPLVTFQLDKGTYLVDATTQFSHLGGVANQDEDYGVVVLSVNGVVTPGASFSSDIPSGGNNASQTTTQQVITITADKTNVTVHGSIRGTSAGQAGASVFATQIAFKS